MPVTLSVKDKIGVIEFDTPDSRVNVLTAEALTRLSAILDEVAGNRDIKAVVFRSAKKGIFIAGADIREIGRIDDPEEGAEKARAGQDVFNKIEDLPVPTIAVINGAALGGGCELALACRWRIATFSDKVKIGLPEVRLGIIPGFGGTYRMPRLVGLVRALKLILPGKALSGKEALKAGLVNQLVPEQGLDHIVYELAGSWKGAGPARHRRTRRSFLERSFLGRRLILAQARKNVLKKTGTQYPAPLKLLDVLQKTGGASRRRALDAEARGFGELAVSTECRGLINVFFLSERYRKLMPEECAPLSPMPIRAAGVIGAGIMGGGIAQILAYKDINVRLKDIQYDALARGLRAAGDVFRKAVRRRKLTKSQAQVKMARISTTVEWTGFKRAQCLIEAVVENMDIKRKVFQEMAKGTDAQALLCTNTSALSVTDLARQVSHPERVVGFHFFNPVHRMPLVEIIRTQQTSAQTLADALGLARRLSKIPVIVRDSPGFLVNRILLAYINEAGRLLEEGQSVAALDQAMKDFGMPMGPFELSDEVGLDVGVKVLHILHEGLGERFRPAELFGRIHKQGLLGRKSGKGFYLHGRVKRLNPVIGQLCAHKGGTSPDDTAASERMILIMINEAARCLQEGLVDEAAAVDVGMIMGTGFPPFQGGLLKYADRLGARQVAARLTYYYETTDALHFKPTVYLTEMAERRETFYPE